MGQLWPAVRASAALQAALLLLSTSEPMRLLLPFPTSWLLFPTAACLLGIWNPGFYVHSPLRALCRPSYHTVCPARAALGNERGDTAHCPSTHPALWLLTGRFCSPSQPSSSCLSF